MGFYVYIIQSEKDHSFYKGFSEQPTNRIKEHNQGISQYTANKIPWKLIYVEELSSKREALIREKKLKKYSHEQIRKLIHSPKNKVKQFL
jgi:putative endonuclease